MNCISATTVPQVLNI